jgi:hypothetical protein
MDFQTAFEPGHMVALLVATVIVLALLYKDAGRLGRLTELYARTHSPMVLASLLGAAVTAIGMVMMVFGAYKLVVAPPQVVMPTGVIRMEVIGGLMVILGWATRIVVWRSWRRRYGPGGVPPARGTDAAVPPDGSAQNQGQAGAPSIQSGKGRRRRRT